VLVTAWLALIGGLVRFEGRKFTALELCRRDPFLSPVGERKPALYIHIPFCKKPCPYCSFHRFQFEEKTARSYFRSLNEEIDLYLDRGFRFSHIYFGGGTPTVMMDELIGLMVHLQGELGDVQVSLETNPRDINREKIAILRELGVVRLSVGVQSFSDEMLLALGRTSHSGEEAKESIKLCRGYFHTLNIDIMYNLPRQSLSMLEADIATAIKLGSQQITFYPYMTPLNRGEGLPTNPVASNKKEADFYRLILKETERNGYTPSTAWCFSKGHRMIDEYLVDYADFIACGCGAVGLYDNIFCANTFSLGEYERQLRDKRLPIKLSRRLSTGELARFRLLTFLFGMGGDKRRLGFDDNEGDISGTYRLVEMLKILGVLKADGNDLKVTVIGMLVASRMMREFFTSLNGLRERCILEGI